MIDVHISTCNLTTDNIVLWQFQSNPPCIGHLKNINQLGTYGAKKLLSYLRHVLRSIIIGLSSVGTVYLSVHCKSLSSTSVTTIFTSNVVNCWIWYYILSSVVCVYVCACMCVRVYVCVCMCVHAFLEQGLFFLLSFECFIVVDFRLLP